MQTSVTEQQRIFWVDMLRILSILMVISTHAGDKIVYDLWGKAPFRHGAISSWWLSGIAYKSLATICVPLLFMLSGYLLLSSKQTPVFYLKKRFSKILIPLFVWSIIYLLWEGSIGEVTSFSQGIKLLTKDTLVTPAYFHLWFLYVLAGLYLVTPVFHRFIMSATNFEKNYIVGLWLVSIFLFSLFRNITGYELMLFNQPYISGYLGYFVAGYLLGNREYTTKQVLIATCVFVILIVSKIIWAYHITVNGGSFDTNLFEYMSWHVVIPSLSGFIVFKHSLQTTERFFSTRSREIIVGISNTTFGIYLVHIIVIHYMNYGFFGFRLYTDSFHPFFAIPITVIVAFIFSLFTVLVIKKIPFLSKITP